jgi:ubiquinone/menaquinone biosynthesis methyltransferase
VNAADKEHLVADVFHKVAEKYDLMNDTMSFGVHRLWKEHFMNRLDPVPGMRLLDVAGGTGDIAFRFLQSCDSKSPGTALKTLPTVPRTPSSVVVCDINPSMLEVGAARAQAAGWKEEQIDFVCGNAEKLPFPDASFDAYTIAFGLRNVTQPDRALREAYRVLRPGGRFMCLEFSHVWLPGAKQAYDAYSFGVIPWMGEKIAGDRDSYQYLVESIRNFPPQEELELMVQDAGFRSTSYENLNLGVAAIHSGFKQ